MGTLKKHLTHFRVFCFALLCLSMFSTYTNAQQHSLILQPSATIGVDAAVSSFAPNNNYATGTTLQAQRWTNGGSPVTVRSYLKLTGVSAIPPGSTIDSARLFLGGVDHSPLTQSNASYLQEVTQTWAENTLTWNNKASTTTTGQISLAQSTSATQNYILNVTSFVQNAIADYSVHYGWMLRLQSETNAYAKLIFATSDYTTDTTKRPKLTIYYRYNQTGWYFRSKQTGNWNSTSTWEASYDGSTNWIDAEITPKYTANTILVQSGHTVTVNATDTVDQLTVDGSLIYSSGTLRINNGTGTDLTVNGTLRDECSNAIVFASSATWSLGSSGYFIKSSSASCDPWRDNYASGISNIPSTAYWIYRKTTSSNPAIPTSGMTYPNLTFENNYSGTWTLTYSGSGSHPTIKGLVDIGGSGSYNVTFQNSNTNSTKIKSEGFYVKSGSTYQLYNNVGIEITGNIDINGTFEFSTYSAPIFLTGGANQSISAASSQTWKNLTINKSAGAKTITLNKSISISSTLTLTKGKIVSSSTNLLTINHGATVSGASDSSFVKGPVKKVGNSAFTFPVGKGSNYQSIAITAPANTTDAFTAEYFDTTQTYGSAHDSTFDYISHCEYFNLARTTGSSTVVPTLSMDLNSCVTFLYPSPRITVWNGSKWTDQGIGSLNTNGFSGDINSGAALTTYGPITIANNSTDPFVPVDTGYVPNSISFIQNNGQLIDTNDSLRSDIKYYSTSMYPDTYFTNDSVFYVLSHIDTTSANDTLVRIGVSFYGGNVSQPVAQNQRESYTNYFLAHCSNGVTNVPEFQRILYKNIYNNIDVVYSANGGGLKQTFNIKPGASPGWICQKYDGADSIKIISNRLHIYTALEDIVYEAPVGLYIDSAYEAKPLVCNWEVHTSPLRSNFTFPNGYNPNLPIAIQIEKANSQMYQQATDNLQWSTFYGGSSYDINYSMDIDESENLYLSGFMSSINFPGTNGLYQDTITGIFDAIISKFDSLHQREWATFLGGTGRDIGTDISYNSVNGKDYVYITGDSDSQDFPILPTNNPNDGSFYDSIREGYMDAIIAKFNANNGFCIRSTYFGGSMDEVGTNIATDGIGNAFVTGIERHSSSTLDYPFKDPNNGVSFFQNSFSGGYEEIYLAKIDSSFNLNWSTLIGGNSGERPRDMKIDKLTNDLLLVGVTASNNTDTLTGNCLCGGNSKFPLCASIQDSYIQTNNYSVSNGFILRFKNNGQLIWSTLFGGEKQTMISGLDINNIGELYVIGSTYSVNQPDTNCAAPLTGFPLCSPYQQYSNASSTLFSKDAFIAKFDTTNKLTWSTFFGGETSEDDAVGAKHDEISNLKIAVDDFNNLFIVGNAEVPENNPTALPITKYRSGLYNDTILNGNGRDVFLGWFNLSNNLMWCTLIGGTNGGDDFPHDLKIFANKNLYICGGTTSQNFPLIKPDVGNPYYQNTLISIPSIVREDGFLSMFDLTVLLSSSIQTLNIQRDNATFFPNPTNDVLYIKLESFKKGNPDIIIYNSLGQIINTSNCKQGRLDSNTFYVSLSSLPTGIYFVTINNESQILSGKIIRNAQ